MRRLRTPRLKPIDHPSAPQLAALADAASGVLETARCGWRLRGRPSAKRHQAHTIESLVRRRFLAVEHGLCHITRQGRALLERESAHAA